MTRSNCFFIILPHLGCKLLYFIVSIPNHWSTHKRAVRSSCTAIITRQIGWQHSVQLCNINVVHTVTYIDVQCCYLNTWNIKICVLYVSGCCVANGFVVVTCQCHFRDQFLNRCKLPWNDRHIYNMFCVHWLLFFYSGNWFGLRGHGFLILL